MTSFLRGGTITAITPQKRRKNRVSVFIDDEFAFGLEAEVAERFGLRTGRMLERSSIEKILSEEEVKRALDRAFRFLAARPRSEQELVSRLQRHGYPPFVIERVLAKCKSLKYIDDRQFALQFARNRLQQRPVGRAMLQAELRRKGLAPTLIEETLVMVYHEQDERALAQRLVEKRAVRLGQLPPEKARARLAAFLRRRGFDWEVVNEVVRKFFRETDKSDAGETRYDAS